MTKYSNLPKKQGLYDPKFEKDNCGIGFIVNIKGIKTHNLVEDAIEILKNLKHRGGIGNEKNTGDGAGILTQIPNKFMQKVCKFKLPKENEYGVGMFFCSRDDIKRQNTINKLTEIIKNENAQILGFRDVPVQSDFIGDTAKESMPYIMQVFIKKDENIKTLEEFERKLFVINKRAEKEIRYIKDGDSYFYFTSISCKTIVYKGMLTAEQVNNFYLDLLDLDFKSAIALVHSRFSTNTFPSWERAHPNRYTVHNGEINTIRGNVNWIGTREKRFESDKFTKEEMQKILPVINEDGSDSSMLDNYIQMLNLSGYGLAESVMMAIPEPWENDIYMNKAKRDFYEYNSLNTEAWDGPTAIGFTDGDIVGATLDRNGLRPARYYITKDDYLILSSEVGVLNIKEENIVKKDRLRAGKMIVVDTKKGIVIEDDAIKLEIYSKNPYSEWVKKGILTLEEISNKFEEDKNKSEIDLIIRQKAFGYYIEDIELTIKDIIDKKEDPIGAMGNDTPLAILSDKPKLLYSYFKQLFAQVTNPPIDAIREAIVTSTICYLGTESNLLNRETNDIKRIRLETPIIKKEEFLKINALDNESFKSINIKVTYNKNKKSMEEAIQEVYKKIDEEIILGKNIIILTDENIDKENVAIPILLICGGVHHHLIKTGDRTKVSIVLHTGEPKEVHHFALLVGYGANAICPYLVYETIKDTLEDYKNKIDIYIKAVTKGIVKIMSKMGISTLQSYQGAQIFEALGIGKKVVDKFFKNTTTRIGGLELEQIEEEMNIRHNSAFIECAKLEYNGEFKWRKDGEYHMFNPETVKLLQKAVREEDYNIYKDYSKLMNSHNNGLCTIRSMLDIRYKDKPINIDEVESVESIVKRFKTGAMSYGSLSQEAHECLAIAMNRLGGKSNSGEGGENKERFIQMENGDSRCSAIKQVASGRFGVSINYLQNAVEIQIKMAQGAKPGEGGHLPSKKVYPWIAKSRNSTTGVSLISPPPHHDIYSIEDLAQLIHDLKNANSKARISVKLVSEAGVGTIAVGVAKSLADVILISGYDGGTGAASKTSIKHAGLPWELGLCETHQSLLLNNLRNKVALEVDGKMLTGRDVLIASLLGAEEFGFSTAPLISIGCVMLRVCHLNTCSVGVATQNPELRKRFKGKPEHIVNLMRFIAMDLREEMAMLGFKTIEDMIGRCEKLKVKSVDGYKAKTIDLSGLLYQPKGICEYSERFNTKGQNHNIEKTFDYNTLLKLCMPAIYGNEKVNAKFRINNTKRVVGTILSSEIAKVKGEKGLKEDSIILNFEGSAGQSLGAFLINGVTIKVYGDCNDYVGKGLSGGKIIVRKALNSKLIAEENVIVGNVCLFGAVAGKVYINGIAGERFAVRNSGAIAVVEGIGEHGLEYMTGGRVLILGEVGKNFGAGMSGGIAFVYDEKENFKSKCNMELILLEELTQNDKEEVKNMMQKHYEYTESEKAKKLLDNLETEIHKFVKVIPKDYKIAIEQIEIAIKDGLSEDEAMMKAFNIITK